MEQETLTVTRQEAWDLVAATWRQAGGLVEFTEKETKGLLFYRSQHQQLLKEEGLIA
jgi:hypothetical protein